MKVSIKLQLFRQTITRCRSKSICFKLFCALKHPHVLHTPNKHSHLCFLLFQFMSLLHSSQNTHNFAFNFFVYMIYILHWVEMFNFTFVEIQIIEIFLIHLERDFPDVFCLAVMLHVIKKATWQLLCHLDFTVELKGINQNRSDSFITFSSHVKSSIFKSLSFVFHWFCLYLCPQKCMQYTFLILL